MKAHSLQIALMIFVFASFGCCFHAKAQLPRDVRDVFEAMLDELDEELQLKFKEAIERESATVEFTPEQFERFRDNPANPFEGLENIDTEIHKGNIALKFELPSIRNRIVDRFERQSQIVLSQIAVNTQSVSASTVKVFSGDRHVAMGIVAKSDGVILTKASEVEDRKDVTCELADGRQLPARTVRVDRKNDLAILQVEATGLPAANWSNRQLVPGSFLLSPAPNGTIMALGTLSNIARSTVAGEQAFLGVKPQTVEQGVRVSEVDPGNASYAAGLRNGDVITKIDFSEISDVSSLVKSIRDRRPGDSIVIEYLRNGTAAKTTATLAAQNISGEQAARFKMMNRLGAIPSRRAMNFPSVIQHDTPLFPEQCGGPVTDVDGNLVGINIARQGRAASFAIPSNHVQTILEDLLRESVARK